MKKLILTLFILTFSLCTIGNSNIPYHKIIKTKKLIIKNFQVTATIYNPTPNQCDSTPFLTADGSKIDTIKLKHRKVRWIGVSRDLLKANGGKFSLGDTIVIQHKNAKLAGTWIIHDKMNKRYRNTIDILQHECYGKYGKWQLTICKYENSKERNKRTESIPLQASQIARGDINRIC